MSFGSIFSRVLGIVYLIPWLMMFGSQQNQMAAQAMFNAAYTPYALFISLGTSGFPTAISRKIAIYNSQGRYIDSRHLFRAGLIFMGISGLLCGAILFFLAPLIAQGSPVVSYQATTVVIRFLTPALLILPIMSIIRGFFQGNQDMQPFGVSQLIEQFIRVAFILVVTYLSLRLWHQSLTMAIGLSTFATFFGAIASLIYLGWYYWRRRTEYQDNLTHSLPASQLNLKSNFLIILKEAIPFVFVGAGITLSQLIDQFSFKQIMLVTSQESAKTIQSLFTLFSANPNKITTVIISLALAISETTLPILASAQFKPGQVQVVIKQNFKMLFGVLTPIIVILAFLGPTINTVFFGYNQQGGQLMRWAIIISFSLAMFTDIFTLIQALGQHRVAVELLVLGIGLKLALQWPMVAAFHEFGALLTTLIAFLTISTLGTGYLIHHCELRFILHNPRLQMVATVLTGASLTSGGIYWIAAHFSMLQQRLGALIFTAIMGVVMLGIYLGMADYFGLARIVLNMKVGYRYRKYKHFE